MSTPAPPDVRLAALEDSLDDCLLSERVRLSRRLRRLREALTSGRPPRRLVSDLDHIAERARRSRRTRVLRQQALQSAKIDFPEQLPISRRADEILAAVREHPVVIVAGDTGSGKTTQIPKICLLAGRGRDARIAVTQPRRVAATSLSRRLAEELGVEWGRQVGARIRFRDRTSPETLVKFVTDGLLLAEVRSDRDLLEYDTLIIDEAHERSLNIDFLLGYVRTLRARRPDLRIIVTSATIDTERFSRAFDGAPVIQVSGRVYPVEVRHWPLEELLEGEDGGFSYTDGAVAACERLLEESTRGDALVFMPSERDIRETRDLLSSRLRERRRGGAGVEVLPLFSRLSAAEQHRVFGPHAGRRIVIATNIAETSLTIPGIRYVVDTGLARISRYNPRTQTQRLPIEEISRSSAEQRKGRCGRVEDGTCVRLYAEEELLARPEHTPPEIQRANLAEVILRMLDLELGRVESFPFLDPPSEAAIRGGYQLLEELGAIDEDRRLTPMGRDMARMPISPAVSRMVLQARDEGSLAEVLVIAAAISVQDPRERPAEEEEKADLAHRRFVHPRSDFLTLLNIWNAFHDRMEEGTQSQLRRFCKRHYLSYLRMREWRDIHAQLRATLGELGGFQLEEEAPGGQAAYDAVHRCLLTGLLSHVGRREDRNLYAAPRGRKAMLFPGSGLFQRSEPKKRGAQTPAADGRDGSGPAAEGAEWVVAAEMVETNRLYARTCAAIRPEWILDLGKHLCRSSHRDPHWSRTAGRVLVHETIRLHGLAVSEGRVGYGRIAPREARDIFVREALISGEIDVAAHGFLDHNRRLHQRLEVWQSRRRGGSPVDLDDAFHDFYAGVLPEGTASVHDLNRVIRDHGGRDDFLLADEARLLGGAAGVDAEAFPEAVDIGGVRLGLSYRHEPGQEADGITLQLPYRLVDAVRPEVLDWLVPGLVEERITALLRSLPKALRKRFVPVPSAARRIAAELKPTHGDGTFLAALESYIEEHWRVQVRRADWDLEAVPEHLRLRVEIEGEGTTLAAGRDLAALSGQLDRPAGAGAVNLEAWGEAARRWEREDITGFDFGDLPERLEVTRVSGVPVFAFPGLVLEENAVHLRLFPDREEARAATPAGFQRLCELALKDEAVWLQRELGDLRSLPADGLAGAPGEFEAQAYGHLARHLFLEGGVFPLTRERFEARVARSRERLEGLSRRFLDLMGEILELKSRLIAQPRPYPGLKEDLRRLLPADFLDGLEFDRLPHLVRYLKAMGVRADRYLADAGRDSAKAAQVEPFARAWGRIRDGLDETPPERRRRAEALRWMVEEFRVSVFAQELGTAGRVSAARLERAIEEVAKAD